MKASASLSSAWPAADRAADVEHVLVAPALDDPVDVDDRRADEDAAAGDRRRRARAGRLVGVGQARAQQMVGPGRERARVHLVARDGRGRAGRSGRPDRLRGRRAGVLADLRREAAIGARGRHAGRLRAVGVAVGPVGGVADQAVRVARRVVRARRVHVQVAAGDDGQRLGLEAVVDDDAAGPGRARLQRHAAVVVDDAAAGRAEDGQVRVRQPGSRWGSRRCSSRRCSGRRGRSSRT